MDTYLRQNSRCHRTGVSTFATQPVPTLREAQAQTKANKRVTCPIAPPKDQQSTEKNNVGITHNSRKQR